MAHLRVSNIAMLTADNAARVRDSIDEADVIELFTGAKMTGASINFAQNGRIILSSLEPTDGRTNRQWIRWQRCDGALNVASEPMAGRRPRPARRSPTAPKSTRPIAPRRSRRQCEQPDARPFRRPAWDRPATIARGAGHRGDGGRGRLRLSADHPEQLPRRPPRSATKARSTCASGPTSRSGTSDRSRRAAATPSPPDPHVPTRSAVSYAANMLYAVVHEQYTDQRRPSPQARRRGGEAADRRRHRQARRTSARRRGRGAVGLDRRPARPAGRCDGPGGQRPARRPGAVRPGQLLLPPALAFFGDAIAGRAQRRAARTCSRIASGGKPTIASGLASTSEGVSIMPEYGWVEAIAAWLRWRHGPFSAAIRWAALCRSASRRPSLARQ